MAYLAAHGEILSKQFHDSRVTVHCRLPKEHIDRIQNDLFAVRPHGQPAVGDSSTNEHETHSSE